jgi:fructan beta-fructosidase
MNFPNQLTLQRTQQGLRLFRQPVAELSLLHGKSHQWQDVTLQPGQNLLEGLQGETVEVRLRFSFEDAAAVVLNLRGEAIRIDSSVELACLGRTMPIDASGTVELQILLDITSIEIFAQAGERVMTSCFLPVLADTSLSLTAEGGAAKLHDLRIYELVGGIRQ